MNASLLQELNAINNIKVTVVEGQSLKVVYITGTSFAKDCAVNILNENNINFTVKISGVINFAVNK